MGLSKDDSAASTLPCSKKVVKRVSSEGLTNPCLTALLNPRSQHLARSHRSVSRTCFKTDLFHTHTLARIGDIFAKCCGGSEKKCQRPRAAAHPGRLAPNSLRSICERQDGPNLKAPCLARFSVPRLVLACGTCRYWRRVGRKRRTGRRIWVTL